MAKGRRRSFKRREIEYTVIQKEWEGTIRIKVGRGWEEYGEG